MAIDPVTLYALGQIGSAAVGGKMAPEPQEMQSFGTAAPTALREANQKLTDFDKFYRDYLAQPVSAPSSFVQQPGGYSGGALPMAFGVSGQDPALSNPSLLTRESPYASYLARNPGLSPGALSDQSGRDRETPESSGPYSGVGGGGRGGRDNSDGRSIEEALNALDLLGFSPAPRKSRAGLSGSSDYR